MEEKVGYHVFPTKRFDLTVPKTFVKEYYCFWEKNWLEKVLWMKRGVSRFSVELFWSHSAEKFRVYPFNVSENLGYRTILCITGVSQFSVGSFLFHSAEKFRGHPFNVSKNLEYQKTLCLIGGITFFPQKFFVSQCPKISWASLQCLRKLGVSKTFMHTRGYHVSPSKIFGLTVPKIFVSFYSMCKKPWGIEKFYA